MISSHKIGFRPLRDDIEIPEVQTTGSAGADLVVPDDIWIPPFASVGHGTLVHLGFALDIPDDMQVHIMLRSSVGLKTPLRLSNGVGLVDSDYKDEICLLLDNLSKTPVFIKSGSRVAQLVPFCSTKWEITSIVPLSREKNTNSGGGISRGRKNVKRKGGFGSTDNNRKEKGEDDSK